MLPLGELNKKDLSLALERKGYNVRGAVRDGTTEPATITVTLPHGSKSFLFVNAFYVHDRTGPYKGLGKRMLCALTQHLALDPATPVELEASGGSAPPDYDPRKETADIDAFFRDRYPHLLEELKDDAKRLSMKEDEFKVLKAETYISVLENQKLIQYYKQYGFETVPGKDMGYYARMRSTVGSILAACTPKGGKKSRRRGRGLRKTYRRKAKRVSSYST